MNHMRNLGGVPSEVEGHSLIVRGGMWVPPQVYRKYFREIGRAPLGFVVLPPHALRYRDRMLLSRRRRGIHVMPERSDRAIVFVFECTSQNVAEKIRAWFKEAGVSMQKIVTSPLMFEHVAQRYLPIKEEEAVN